ncbi:hypothetical protein BSLG_002192 [Batrachochytrium salamandrivorans]|nr:hypothetical protein BSLG_002192 [Batrachochytrium salamandrivorans]
MADRSCKACMDRWNKLRDSFRFVLDFERNTVTKPENLSGRSWWSLDEQSERKTMLAFYRKQSIPKPVFEYLSTWLSTIIIATPARHLQNHSHMSPHTHQHTPNSTTSSDDNPDCRPSVLSSLAYITTKPPTTTATTYLSKHKLTSPLQSAHSSNISGLLRNHAIYPINQTASSASSHSNSPSSSLSPLNSRTLSNTLPPIVSPYGHSHRLRFPKLPPINAHTLPEEVEPSPILAPSSGKGDRPYQSINSNHLPPERHYPTLQPTRSLKRPFPTPEGTEPSPRYASYPFSLEKQARLEITTTTTTTTQQSLCSAAPSYQSTSMAAPAEAPPDSMAWSRTSATRAQPDLPLHRDASYSRDWPSLGDPQAVGHPNQHRLSHDSHQVGLEGGGGTTGGVKSQPTSFMAPNTTHKEHYPDYSMRVIDRLMSHFALLQGRSDMIATASHHLEHDLTASMRDLNDTHTSSVSVLRDTMSLLAEWRYSDRAYRNRFVVLMDALETQLQNTTTDTSRSNHHQ